MASTALTIAIMEAIILAGGLGTRLRSEVKDLPKSMASINSRPFMEYLLDQLISEGVTRFIFSVGYKAEFIQNHFQDKYRDCEVLYATEFTQLGTGGAIKNAMRLVSGQNVIVVNGDSIFISDLKSQLDVHIRSNADVTLALKPMKNVERYGTVELNVHNRVTRFNEKKPLKEGLINTGTYIFNVDTFQSLNLPDKFSIEEEFFKTHLNQLDFIGFSSSGYFLDIGIPEDFNRAQYELGVFSKIDLSWTLFLDKDNLIKKRQNGDSVNNLGELELMPSAIKAVADLSKIFGRIVIVISQQGTGQKPMETNGLDPIHEHLLQQVKNNGGQTEAIYKAPQLLLEKPITRMPKIGRALQAKADNKEIELSKSIMIGNSLRDIEHAEQAGMIAVLIGEGVPREQYKYSIDSLLAFAELLRR